MQTNKLIQELYYAALKEIDPQNLINTACKLEGERLYIHGCEYELCKYERIYILGSGKAVFPMAKALKKMLNPFVDTGLIVGPVCHEELDNISCMQSDHPIPSEKSLEGARALIEKISQCRKNDLFIYLLSGGSSSLIELPVEGISLDDLQICTELMLKSGLKIDEINAVRKHISSIKGGRLATHTDAEGIVLCVSDVIGDDLYSIGSAPLYADKSSFEDAVGILEKYNIFTRMPASIQKTLNDGLEHIHLETPKSPSERIKHFLIGSNTIAKEAVYERALELGYETSIVAEAVDDDVHVATKKMLDIALSSTSKIIIFGGETTVKVEGNGKGGRNQHAVLDMLKLVSERGLNIVFLSAGTDGIDGNSDAAGAWIDSQSMLMANEKGLDINTYLKENDSYHFFKQLDNLVMTGPTGTNVMDIAILIKEL